MKVQLDLHDFIDPVDIHEIKEVRVGTDSKDFDMQQLELEEIGKFCFTIYYGSEFNLKTLSVTGNELNFTPNFMHF